MKPFVKYVNYTHIMPTRYSIPSDMEAKTLVTDSQMDTPDGRVDAKKALCGNFNQFLKTSVRFQKRLKKI